MNCIDLSSFNLGERIVKAARLAAAVHLGASVSGKLISSSEQHDQTRPEDGSRANELRQRVRIGGAGPVVTCIAHDGDARHATLVTEDGRSA